MAHADQSLSYEGVFVYIQGTRVDVMRVVRSVEKGVERERLVALNGPVREVIRQGDTVTCILPDDESVSLGTKPARIPIPKLLADRLAQIDKSYALSLDGEARVAGRQARQIAIRPRDGLRYGHDLWLDDATGMLLRSQTVDSGGHQVEQMLFATVELVPSVPAALLAPQTEGRRVTWHMPDARGTMPDDERWRVTWLPSGFVQTAHERRQVMPQGSPIDHLVFSDGLASVSLFVEQANGAGETAESERVEAMGAMHAYRRRLANLLITVVGEVPAATVRRIADSIRERAESR
jgi:sigma-E factor negative regulatory protein RseB